MTPVDRQEALDRKEIRDDAEYWRLSDEIEAAHPDWDGAQIYDEIVRKMTEGIEED